MLKSEGTMELWRQLKVGDRVRIFEYPPEFSQPGYFVHRDTRRVYKKLIARGSPLRIFEIDAWGSPWICCRFRRKNGSWERHFLSINHDGLVRVKSRKSREN
jgi:hypothetical protein